MRFQGDTGGVSGETLGCLQFAIPIRPFPFSAVDHWSQQPFPELNFANCICAIEGKRRAGIVRELVLSRVESYRSRAAECEAMAASAPDPQSKAVLEEMAATWRKLAERVEKWELP